MGKTMLAWFGERLGLVVLATAVAALSTACDVPEEAKGNVKAGANFQSALQVISKATLTIGPGTGTPSFNPIVAEMTQDTTDSNWTAYVQGIPAGSSRTFHIDAFDDSTPANVLYSGDATSEIIVGATANVFMLLQAANSGGDLDGQILSIDRLTATADVVAVGTPVFFSVAAHDLAGDRLTYRWTSSCGAFADPATTTPTWTAPTTVPSNGSCQIEITVENDEQDSLTASLAIVVRQTNAGNEEGPLNSWPIFVLAPQIAGVELPNGNDTVQPGQTVTLGVSTLDPMPNGATAETPFTYAWTQTGGNFVSESQVDSLSNPGGSEIQWTAPNPLVIGMTATVVVTNMAGLTATQTFVFTADESGTVF